MANEFIVRTGLKVTGSANIQSSLSVPTLTVSGTGSFGNVTVAGNLDVLGTINAVNETTLNVADKVISVAAGATSTSQADGAGLFISGANASLLWDNANSKLVLNKPTSVDGAFTATSLAGTGGSITGLDAGNISTGTISDDRLPSTITSDITGNAATATLATTANTASYVAGSNVNGQVASAANANTATTASYATQAVTLNGGVPGSSFSYDVNTGRYTTQVSIEANGFIGNLTGTADSANVASSANSANELRDGLSIIEYDEQLEKWKTNYGFEVRTGLAIRPLNQQPSTINKQQSTSVNTSIKTVSEMAVSGVDAVFFDYVVKNSTTDLRTGTVMAVTNGSTVEYTETSTNDIGNTSGVTLSVDLNSGNIRLRAVAASGTWTVRALVRTI